MTLSIDRINKARQAGYKDDDIVDSIAKRDPEFGTKIQKAREAGYDSGKILQSIESKLSLNAPRQANNSEIPNGSKTSMPEIPDNSTTNLEKTSNKEILNNSKKTEPSYTDFFKQGLKTSATGELANIGGKTPEQVGEDPSFWQSLVQESGNIVGDTPYLLAGATLGSSLGAALGAPAGPFGAATGGLLGGGFGAFALPEFIKSTLQEYRDYVEKGNDLTYGEFLQRADRVGSKTINSGLMGAILGQVNKAAPLLKNIPGLGKLFESKIAQKGATIAGETAAVAAIPSLSKGELPESKDFAHALALVLGFNALSLPGEIRNKLNERGKSSGLTPEEFAKTPEAKEIINEAVKEPVKEIKVPIEEPPSKADQKIEAPQEEIKLEKGEREPIIEVTGQGAEQRLEEPPTLMSKLKEKASSVVEAVSNPYQLQQEIYTKAFDALEPINRLETGLPVEERVTTKIKQAQSAASDINNVLTQGIFDNVSNKFTSGSLKDVYLEQGDVWKRATKGLKEGEYSVKEMDVYRTSKEALKRQKKGLKSGIDTDIATKDVARLKQKYGPVDQRLREFQKNTLDSYGKNLLDAETRKQWTQESHASLYRVMDYGKDAIVKEGSLAPKKPWYKAKGSGRKIIPPSESDIQNLSMLITNAKKNDSILQYKKLVEQGKLPGRIVKSKNKPLPEKMIEDLELDPDNAKLAETLYNQSRKDSFTPETGRIRGWENGKPFEIEVPKDVYETYASLAPSDTGMFTQIFRATNNLMSRGIVLEPRKFFSIVGRDALSSLIYSKTGSNPISIVHALTDIYKDSHSWNQFKSLGGEQYVSRLMTRADRAAKIEELIKSETKAKLIPFNKLGTFLKEFNSKLAASVPFAEYQRGVKKYGDTPSGRLQALIGAKEVTYDPTKRGSSKLVKGAANFLPFFNVMLQEPAMIAKNLKRPEFIGKGIIGITLPSLLLKMYNEGNPDYDDMNPLLKASCWHFYTDKGHFAVPVPWLLGATFKSAPEAFYDMVKGKGGDAWKGLYSYIASQLSGSFPPIVQAAVEQSTGRSLPTPAGLALMPFGEVEKRAPEVVPRRLQNLPPEQQYTSKTSQLARWYGDMWKVSPVKVERLIKTFGGGLATDALALIDEIAYRTGLAEDLRPEQGARNYLLLGNFLYENTPTNTKYTNDFYTRLEESKIEKKRGNEHDSKILNSYNKKISQNFKQYRDIESQKIDPKKKRQLLQQKQKEINALYKEAVLKTNK